MDKNRERERRKKKERERFLRKYSDDLQGAKGTRKS